MVLILIDPTPEELEAHKKFPSPCGDYGSYLPTGKNGTPSLIISFPSPYGDYGSYLLDDKFTYIGMTAEFPSPYGDYGSYHFICYQLFSARNLLMFPSPYGDYGSYHAWKQILAQPLQALFPSPYGDYGSYLDEEVKEKVKKRAEVSVPLRGLWFLSYMTSMYIPLTTTLCFRPLAGIMVLIANETMLQLRRTTSFRPLTGIMVLIAKYLDSVLKFPSPYGDYGSYLDKRWYNKTAKWFPSPYGDYGSYPHPL